MLVWARTFRGCIIPFHRICTIRHASSSKAPITHPGIKWQLYSSGTLTGSCNQISGALLQKARATAEEHRLLNEKLANEFSSSTAKRLGELSAVVEALRDWDKTKSALQELNELIKDPSSDKEIRDLADEDLVEASTRYSQASQVLTNALIPRHPFAHLPCLIEIRPGIGGSEAALFAGDLLRMYQSLCSRRRLQVTLLKYEDQEGMSDPNGSDAPLQEAILDVSSPGAYNLLRTEAGVHRVQRVPATESKGRVHTSAANVLVLPNLPVDDGGEEDFNDPNSDYFVSSADVRIDVMRAAGAGGQHVNKTESAVRLTHIPTETVVKCQESRSQQQNRQKAWQILRAKLAQSKREARDEEMMKFRRSTSGHGKFGRGDKVRTYNWSQQRVTDHRSGLTINQLDNVVEGGEALDTIIESVDEWMQDQEIQRLVDDSDVPRNH